MVTTLPIWGRRLLIAAVVVILPLSVSLSVVEPTPNGTLPSYRSAPHPSTVALIAFDGLSWNVLEPLIEEGRLPNFAHLTAGGSYGELATIPLGSTPLIWNTISTGHEPSRSWSWRTRIRHISRDE